MKQYLYTCCRCGQELRSPTTIDDAPLGWAVVTFERDVVEGMPEDRQLARHSLTTHACSTCAEEVQSFLEKSSRAIDDAFDDGGVS